MKRAIENMSQEPRFSPSHGVCPLFWVTFLGPVTQLCVMFGFWQLPFSTVSCGLPGGSVVKSLPASAGGAGSTPGPGSSLGEGTGYPLQYSCLGNPMDRGAWQAMVHQVAKESDMIQRLNNNNCLLHCPCSPFLLSKPAPARESAVYCPEGEGSLALVQK